MVEKLNGSLNVKTRIEWLDIAKGLGVLLVVIGHLWYECIFPVINQIIYSFHMPMFFILSGFVFKKGSSNFISFVLAKSKRLLLPTFVFFVLGVVGLFFFGEHSGAVIIRRFFFIDGICPYNDPCWYFITLFQLLIVSYFLNLNKSSFLFKGIVIVIAFILGFVLYEFEAYIPFGIGRTVVAMVFFAFGTLLSQGYRENKKIQNKYLKILMIVGCFALWIICGVVLNEKVSFCFMDLNNFFLFIIAGLCGSIVFIEICKLLQKSKIKGFFTKTADNSIIIIGTHYFLKSIFLKVMASFNLFKTWQYTLIALSFSILIVIIYNCLGGYFKKYAPAITGDLK